MTITMLALELVADRSTREPLEMQSASQDVIRRETGVIVHECAHSLVISPRLIMSRAEGNETIDAIRTVLERMDTSGAIAPAS
jgi:PLP-dependent transaminase